MRLPGVLAGGAGAGCAVRVLLRSSALPLVMFRSRPQRASSRRRLTAASMEAAPAAASAARAAAAASGASPLAAWTLRAAVRRPWGLALPGGRRVRPPSPC